MKKPTPSFNEMKKTDLEKGLVSKLSIAAMLAGPIAMKGTMFDPPQAPISRNIAGQPASEKHDEDSGKHEAVKHVTGPANYTVTHISGKADTVKQKLTSIRNQIKGME